MGEIFLQKANQIGKVFFLEKLRFSNQPNDQTYFHLKQFYKKLLKLILFAYLEFSLTV